MKTFLGYKKITFSNLVISNVLDYLAEEGIYKLALVTDRILCNDIKDIQARLQILSLDYNLNPCVVNSNLITINNVRLYILQANSFKEFYKKYNGIEFDLTIVDKYINEEDSELIIKHSKKREIINEE